MNYKEYINSTQWKLRSRLYRNAHPQCEICGCDDKFMLRTHHISYKNLGNESDEDLMTLCIDCHEGIESIKNFTEENYRECADFIANADYDNTIRALGQYGGLYEIILSYPIRKCLTCCDCVVSPDHEPFCFHGDGISHLSDLIECDCFPCHHYEKGNATLPYKENEPILISFDGHSFERRLFSEEKYKEGIIWGWAYHIGLATHIEILPETPHTPINVFKLRNPVLHYFSYLFPFRMEQEYKVFDPIRNAIEKIFHKTYPKAIYVETKECYEYCKQRVAKFEDEVSEVPHDHWDIGLKKLLKPEISTSLLWSGFPEPLEPFSSFLGDWTIERIKKGLDGIDDRITYAKDSCNDLLDFWMGAQVDQIDDFLIWFGAVMVIRYLLELIDCYREKYPSIVHNAKIIAVCMMRGLDTHIANAELVPENE